MDMDDADKILLLVRLGPRHPPLMLQVAFLHLRAIGQPPSGTTAQPPGPSPHQCQIAPDSTHDRAPGRGEGLVSAVHACTRAIIHVLLVYARRLHALAALPTYLFGVGMP